MPRIPRRYLPDGVYHVTNRGVDGAPIYLDDLDRLCFRQLLWQISPRFAWEIDAYCLMTNHYHLIVETSCAQLSGGLRRLNGVYAQRFNRRHARTGHLFQGRFSAYVIDDEAYREAACLYVLANPVRAGLCENVGDWAWSGGRAAA